METKGGTGKDGLEDIPPTPLRLEDDIDLSPQSKKIIEEFKVPIAPPAPPVTNVKAKPSLILRPKSSGIFATPDFQFAKPARAAGVFSLSAGARRNPGAQEQNPTDKPSRAATDCPKDAKALVPAVKRHLAGEPSKSPAISSSAKPPHTPTKKLPIGQKLKALASQEDTDHDGLARQQPSSSKDLAKDNAIMSNPSKNLAERDMMTVKHATKECGNDHSSSLLTTPSAKKRKAISPESVFSAEDRDSSFFDDTQITSPLASSGCVTSKEGSPSKAEITREKPQLSMPRKSPMPDDVHVPEDAQSNSENSAPDSGPITRDKN
ncbi:hypothetical protein KEM55_001578, partial [Ascosphaera atra]